MLGEDLSQALRELNAPSLKLDLGGCDRGREEKRRGQRRAREGGRQK